jgi:hypothetical protein
MLELDSAVAAIDRFTTSQLAADAMGEMLVLAAVYSRRKDGFISGREIDACD